MIQNYGYSLSGHEKFIEVLVTLWAIWWTRRKIIHEEEYQSPLSTHGFITRYLEDLKYVRKQEVKLPTRV
jgi:hypothetical protein